MDKKKSCGFVALLGEPNAGKSTLLNFMVGTKVSIVTHKVQTTRTRIRGVSILGDSQIIFVDTPGLFRPRRRLDRAMVKAAWTGALDADIIVFLIEANRGITDGVRENLEKLKDFNGLKMVTALAINKIDRVKSEELLELTKELNDEYAFDKTFLISAKKGHGVPSLKEWLGGQIPLGEWHYPEDQIADLSLRMMTAEILREKLTLRLHQELPYQLTVETESWEDSPDGSVKINQIKEIAENKMKDLNAANIEGAIEMVKGSARSMGLEVLE